MDIQLSFLELRCKEVINVINGKRLGHIIDIVFNAYGKIHGIVLPAPRRFLWWKTCEDIVIKWCDIDKIGADVILVKPGHKDDKRDDKCDCRRDGRGNDGRGRGGREHGDRDDDGCRVRTVRDGFDNSAGNNRSGVRSRKHIKEHGKKHPYNFRQYGNVFTGENFYDSSKVREVNSNYDGEEYFSEQSDYIEKTADDFETESDDGLYEMQEEVRRELYENGGEREYYEVRKETG